MVRKAILAWLLMIPVAILNGGLRQSVFVPAVGELRAHQLSVLTGSTAFFAVIYAMIHREAPGKSDRWLLRLGGVWVTATVVFEFGFGHWVMGNSWNRLLADYNIFAGRLWTVVLAVIGVAPLAAKRLATRRQHAEPRVGHRLAGKT
jgi:hypothetical protein